MVAKENRCPTSQVPLVVGDTLVLWGAQRRLDFEVQPRRAAIAVFERTSALVLRVCQKMRCCRQLYSV